MNIWIGILFFAAGMLVDAFYNSRKQKAEADAYLRGYKNAKNEEQHYKDGVNYGCIQEKLNRPVEMSAPKHERINIPESFVNNVKQNGQATLYLK